MKQEDKELLLKDLCSRLPYGVKGLVTFNGNIFKDEDRTIDGKLYDRFAEFQDSWYDNVTIKPYLFPLSSMTKEQCRELRELINTGQNDNNEFMRSLCRIEFYHKHHLDYRGLIEKGIAIDATGLNVY